MLARIPRPMSAEDGLFTVAVKPDAVTQSAAAKTIRIAGS